MNQTIRPLGEGAHFRAASFGRFDALKDHRLEIPALGRSVRGKVFLRDPLGLTGMDLSLTSIPPGGSVPFLHRHRENEELYLFLRGTGEMLVDEQVIPVGEGSAVRIAPEGERTLRNTGAEPLVYTCIQARQGSLPGDAGITDGVPVAEPPRWPS